MLVATNFLGINTAAIMATEAQYAEMWAQDAAAMYGYAGSSAAAATLTPFTPPQQNTNPAGLAAQSAAVANSGGTQTSTTVDTIIQQILADINKALEPDTVNSGISAFATVPSIILSALSALSAGSNSAATAADATVAALTDVSAGLGKSGDHSRLGRRRSGRRCGVCRIGPGSRRRRAVGAAGVGHTGLCEWRLLPSVTGRPRERNPGASGVAAAGRHGRRAAGNGSRHGAAG